VAAVSEPRAGARLRAEAAKAVDSVVSDGRSLDVALGNAKVPDRDKALLRLLCYGAIRQHWRLDWQISQLLDRPLKRRDGIIRSLLAIGLYQIASTRIPDHAAVSMTVEAARLLRRPKYSGLVNAVLRNFMRKNIAAAQPTTDEARYDHPHWLLERLKRDWPDRWQDIVSANNERAPMWLRVNERRCPAAEYLERLASAGIAAQGLSGVDGALRLADPVEVHDLPGFDDGVVSVQDGAAQLAAPWLLAGNGARILDACAAPGGKTGHLLELAGGQAALTAIDVDKKRLGAVADNLARLGLTATLVHADASHSKEWWDGEPFNHVLLDAPCSGSGVIRRHPDIRLLRRDSDISAMAALQGRLLAALWPLLTAGGRLLYVTCSVLEEENDAVVEGFLAQHPDATESQVLPNYNIHALMCRKTCGYQVLPGTSGLDGFYFACLTKNSGTKT
jgi:16S rRNA (cytosine967-C5)-methyltransferase